MQSRSRGSQRSSACSTNGKGISMQKKLCSECGEMAEVSLCQILSTVGRTPRRQRCSLSTSFCAPCLQGRIKLLRRSGLHCIQKPLSEAFTTLADGCEMRLSRRSQPGSAVATESQNFRTRIEAPSSTKKQTAFVRLEGRFD
jgi:hypothetical protein